MSEYFIQEPILLHNPDTYRGMTNTTKVYEPEMIEISQHLKPEQYLYEFPPKSCIEALDVDDDPTIFFDDCSFTSNSTAAFYIQSISDMEQLSIQEDTCIEDEDRILLEQYIDSYNQEQNDFIADHQLSPLQLPQKVEDRSSYGSLKTIKTYQPARPSSYLSAPHRPFPTEKDRINWDETSFIFPDYSIHEDSYHTSIHPFSRRNSLYLNHKVESQCSNHSKVIYMKMNKNESSKPPIFIHDSRSFMNNDEGFEEDVEDKDLNQESPIDSTSHFIPFSSEQIKLEAAIKIQAIWRGYSQRKKEKNSSHRVLAGLAQLNESIHRRNYKRLYSKLSQLENQLIEERTMRLTFEKAMEDMTVLIDEQHHILHERLEQEVHMRQAYERKMEKAISQIHPLESRLKQETAARADMESMMSHILDQLHDLKFQMKDQVDQRLQLQIKLDQANKEILSFKNSDPLKKQSSHKSTKLPSTLKSNPTHQIKRPTTIPSIRDTTPLKKSIVPKKSTLPIQPSSTTKSINSRPTKSPISRLSTRSTLTSSLNSSSLTKPNLSTIRSNPTRKSVIPKKL